MSDQKDDDRDENKEARERNQKFQVTDRRFWVEEESALKNASVPAPRYPSFVEELKARTELAEERLRGKMEQLDQENEAFRQRLKREAERRQSQDIARLIQDFLEVGDNLERALQASAQGSDFAALHEGVERTLDLFHQKLKALQVETVEVLEETFDPHLAEAVGTLAVEEPQRDGKVVEVLQKGYRRGEELIRPARVRVGEYSAPGNQAGGEATPE